jgi:lipoprotein-releasing system permease protein
LSFEYFISRRFLKAKKSSFVSLISFLSTAGTALGVMALIIVIAVMTGFGDELRKKILGVEAHAVLLNYGGAFKDYNPIAERVRKYKEVVSASPFIISQGMLKSAHSSSGAVLRGVDFNSSDEILKLIKTKSMAKKEKNIPQIFIGRQLAKILHVELNDIVYLILTQGRITPIGHMPAMKRAVVAGFFESGMYEYDSSLAYMDIKDAQKLLNMKDLASGISIRVKDIYKAASVSQKIADDLGYPYWAKDWINMNKSFFSALKLEKTVMFIILTLIVLVAAFNIASSLIMMFMERIKDIAILKAMGATDKSIRRIFMIKGLIIGGVGVLSGVFLGILTCGILSKYKFIELPQDVYFISTLPVQLNFFDVFLIAISAMFICFLATIYPAYKASKVNPVEAIRYG